VNRWKFLEARDSYGAEIAQNGGTQLKAMDEHDESSQSPHSEFADVD
jgi:hypothetical protein